MARAIVILLAAVALTMASSARARAAEASPPAEAQAPAYTLEVDSDAPAALSYDAVAARLATDLGGSVSPAGGKSPTRAAVTIRYRDASRLLTVRADHAGGRSISREVTAEGDAAAVQREAILLAGNLARDEASELIDELAAKKTTPAAIEDKPPEPAPAPAPALEPEAAPAPIAEAPALEPPEVFHPVTVAFVHPLATNFAHPDVRTAFSLSIVYGHVGRVNGLDLSSAVAHARRVKGAQVATGLALTIGDLNGFQGSAGAAITTGRVDGLQLAIVSIGQDVSGAQIGIVNVGKRVKGLQLGLVNIAEEVDGAAIGMASITRDLFHPIAWASNLAYATVGVKFSTKYAYTITALGLGSLETNLAKDGVSFTVAIGARVPLGRAFDLEIETAYTEQELETRDESNRALHPRLLPGYSFGKRLRVFAGAGIRVPIVFGKGSPVVRPEGVLGVQF